MPERHRVPSVLIDGGSCKRVSYKHMMTQTKEPISVTLQRDNIKWLKGRAAAAGIRSMSELLDRIVTAARTGGRTAPVRTVAGTVEIDASDPALEHADAAVSAVFEQSLGRPFPQKHRKTRG